MGITIVQKSDLAVVKPWAPKALVLSGGAITGASFKAGGIKAFNDYLTNFSVNDFDLYVGISSGSLLAVTLAAGLSPEEILRSLDGTSTHYRQLAPWHFYWPNYKELFSRPLEFCLESALYWPRLLADLLGDWRALVPQLLQRLGAFVRHPTPVHYTALLNVITSGLSQREGPSLLKLLPTGIFDNAPIEKYLRQNIERNHLTNNFEMVERMRKKRLYICAMTLDGAERVVFGPDERRDVTISEAVQASTALPFFYKPARVRGIDYVDGGVFSTSHLDVAVKKGAELIVCYNPFRPIDNHVFWEYIRKDNRYVTKGRPLAMNGITTVMNQVFRAIFHTRLHQTLRHYRDSPDFHGDIILVEPRASDMTFFEMNPLLFSNRAKAARIGFESVRNSINEKYDAIAPILAAYGIQMSHRQVDADFERLQHAGRDTQALQRVLEGRATRAARRARRRRTTR